MPAKVIKTQSVGKVLAKKCIGLKLGVRNFCQESDQKPVLFEDA